MFLCVRHFIHQKGAEPFDIIWKRGRNKQTKKQKQLVKSLYPPAYCSWFVSDLNVVKMKKKARSLDMVLQMVVSDLYVQGG